MSSSSLRLLALAVAAFLLAGCNAAGNMGSTSTMPNVPNVAGNWQFSTLYPGPAPQNFIYTGALSQQGTTLTAILRAYRCFLPTQDIEFTGTIDAAGNFTLSSANLPSNAIAIAGTITTTNGVTGALNAILTISGSAPCAISGSTSITGFEAPSFTGKYAGSITSTTGSAANFSVSLTQGPANSDGQFPLTGSLTISSSSCTAVFPISTVFAGLAFVDTDVASTSGPPSIAELAAGVLPETPPLLSIEAASFIGCNDGIYTGSLAAQ